MALIGAMLFTSCLTSSKNILKANFTSNILVNIGLEMTTSYFVKLRDEF